MQENTDQYNSEYGHISCSEWYSYRGGSWKLYLNLYSCKWLDLVINFIPMIFWLLKKLFGNGLMNFRMLQRNKLQISQFLSSWSKLFHSIVVDEKTNFWKTVCLVLKRGTASIFLVIHGEILRGIKLYR